MTESDGNAPLGSPEETGAAAMEREPAERGGVSDEYLNNVSHELRGSLNTILGWAELIRTRSFDEAGRVRAAETILRHAQQQLWLLNNLFDTWRLLSGTLRLNVGSVDWRDLVASAAQAIEPIAAAKQIEVNLDLTPLPGDVRGDAQRLKQAVVALLSNAVHFMTSGGTIDVRLVPSPGGAQLTMRDNGLAVGASALPYLFDRHRPKDPARASRRGDLGLGLSLIRDIVDLHGGSIEVESDGRCGLTFKLSLPLEAPPQVVRADVASTPAAGPSDYPMHSRLLGLTVLLVEDEVDAREAEAELLRYYGAAVVPVASVPEAMAALRQERVDVLVTDIAMPGEDGYDLIRRMQGLDEGINVPAVALTACASEDDRQRAFRAGFDVHLAKPADPWVLVDTVEKLGKRLAGAGP